MFVWLATMRRHEREDEWIENDEILIDTNRRDFGDGTRVDENVARDDVGTRHRTEIAGLNHQNADDADETGCHTLTPKTVLIVQVAQQVHDDAEQHHPEIDPRNHDAHLLIGHHTILTRREYGHVAILAVERGRIGDRRLQRGWKPPVWIQRSRTPTHTGF